MPKFSKQSLQKLNTCDDKLIHLCNEVIQDFDFMVICGHRGEKEQNLAFEQGYSKLKYPKSKHNYYPSKAVDLVPYPIDWNDIERFKKLGKCILEAAKKKNIKIRWGGDFNGNGKQDDKFLDFPHFELVE